MKAIPSYGKVLTLGSAFTENAVVGPIVMQEKVDGSLFAFGINEDGQVVMRSKRAVLTEDNYAEMFKEVVEYTQTLYDRLRFHVPLDTYFYCEYLQKPKHNTLKYRRIRTNHLVLFDVVEKGKYADRERLEKLAKIMDIEVIPEFWRGDAVSYVKEDLIKRIIETTTSFLGDEIVEGIVIKNYDQTILLGGSIFPLFTKYVRESFKERHEADWKIRQPKSSLQDYVEGFRAEARWQKAVIHAREQGKLEQSPRDIGFLIKKIQEDIKEEETENIKNHLYKCFIDDILRKSVQKFPEWYKEQLLKNLNTGEVSK